MVREDVYVCVYVCVGSKEVKEGWIKSDLRAVFIFTRSSAEQGTFVLTGTNRSHRENKAMCVEESEYVKYHVYRTAVYYACQSQYVYMTALWLRSAIFNSLKDHWRVPL